MKYPPETALLVMTPRQHQEQSTPRATTANTNVSSNNTNSPAFLEPPTSRWVKNDYELVRWPPDAEKDKAAGIHVAGEEQEDDTPDAAQVRLCRSGSRQGALLGLSRRFV